MRMSTKVQAGTLFLLASMMISCVEDPDFPVAPQQEDSDPNTISYAPLSVGSYWIYERFELDTAGNEVALGIMDSCFIAADTVIGSNTYAVYVRPFAPGWQPLRQCLRDSLDFVVDQFGRIQFAQSDLSTIFYPYVDTIGADTLSYWRYQMVDDGLLMTVPAGTFSTKTWQLRIEHWPGHIPPAGALLTRNTRYAENVGIIVETLPFYFAQVTKQERRLVSWHIQ